jgi:hypothetical protein
MDMEKDHIIEECRYCGNKTKLDIVASYHISCREEYCYDIDWLILRCCVCEDFSFAKNYCSEDSVVYLHDSSEKYEEELDILYPVKTYQGNNVPKEVNKAFEAALKARHLNNEICLVALRRTLEIICKEQGETTGTLVIKIRNLADKHILPPILKDASGILRKMGNEAAHGDNITYSPSTIAEMINFTQIIIEYVYVLPYRIEKIKVE